jgi:hypothetical protein
MSDFGLELIDKWEGSGTLGVILLTQTGPVPDFGQLDEGDQIEVLSLQVNVDGIRLIARANGKEKTFNLRCIRDERPKNC